MKGYTIPTTFQAVDKMSKTVNAITRKVTHFGAKAQVAISKVERGYRAMSKQASFFNNQAKKTVAIVAGLAVGAGVMGGADAFLSLDKNLSAASAKFAVFDRNSEVFKAIEDKAIEMGVTTEFTSGQAASALMNMATAGFTANQAIAGIPKVLDLATATQTELTAASEVAAKTLAAFGLKSNDPKKLDKNLGLVSDTLNKIITTSGFGNLEEFLDAISQSGSQAKAAGVDIKTWGAVIASSVSEAVPASKAGTRFANMLSYMSKNQKKFKQSGIAVADVNGNYRDFIDIMKDLEKSTKGMGQTDQSDFLFGLFGERGAKMAQSILSNGVDSLAAYRQELIKSEGISQKMASFMRSGLTGGVNAAKSAFESIAIAIGKTFQPEIDDTIKSLTGIARGAKEWIERNKSLLKGIMSAVKWITYLFLAFKAFGLIIAVAKMAIAGYNIVLGISTALMGWNLFALRGNTMALAAYRVVMSVATAAQWAWAAALSVGIWPLTLITIGIAALIALITVVVKKYDEWGAALTLIMGPLGMVINLVMAFRKNWDAIKAAFKNGGIISGIKAIGITILEAIIKPVAQLMGLIEKFTGWEWAKSATAGIGSFQNTLTAQLNTSSRGGTALAESPTPLLNPEKSKQEAMQQLIQTNNASVDLNVNDPNGRIDASTSTPDFIKIITSPNRRLAF